MRLFEFTPEREIYIYVCVYIYINSKHHKVIFFSHDDVDDTFPICSKCPVVLSFLGDCYATKTNK